MADEPQWPPRTDDAAAIGCTVEHSHVGAVCVVSVSGAVDALTAPRLSDGIAAAASSAPAALIVDLTAVDFLASAGMGALVVAHADLKQVTRFVMVADGPATSRLLKLVGITDLIDLYATLDDALAAVRP